MGRLEGKVALITGGAGGIGGAQTRLFAAEGATSIILDAREDQARALANSLVRDGGRAAFHKMDVTIEGDWQRTVDAIVAAHGRIDVLVNSAGVHPRAGIVAQTLEDWEKVLRVNLTGAFLGMKYVFPAMTGGGSIINISSAAGLTTSTSAGYTASKWGLRGLTRVAALEFASAGVRVNTICPGLILTELNAGQPYLETRSRQTPLNRPGTTEEVAELALYLASDLSRYVTGADMAIDGGLSIARAGK